MTLTLVCVSSESPDGIGRIVLRHDINTKFGGFFISNPPPYGVRGPAYAVTVPAGYYLNQKYSKSTDSLLYGYLPDRYFSMNVAK
jgi:hypothetical protein